MAVPLVATIRRAPLIAGAMASDGEALRVIVPCPLWPFAAPRYQEHGPANPYGTQRAGLWRWSPLGDPVEFGIRGVEREG